MRIDRSIKLLLASLMAFSSFATNAAAEPSQPSTSAPASIEQFVKLDKFSQLKISPSGEYLAATVPLDNRTVLAVLRRSDMKAMSVANVTANSHIQEFWWVNDRRLLYTLAEKGGSFDQTYPTGEIFATDFDGKGRAILIGRRSGEESVKSRIKSRTREYVSGDVVDTLPGNDDFVLVSVTPWTAGEEPFTTLQRMHVRTGVRSVVARAPVRRGGYAVDHKGVARFAYGAGVDLKSKLYYRPGDDTAWELVNDEAVSGLNVAPLGFNSEGSIAYLQTGQVSGPDAIHAFDTRTRKQTLLARDAKVNPSQPMWRADQYTPFAVQYLDGQPRVHFLDEAAPESKLLKSLQKSFPGHAVEFTGFTRDGKLALVYVYSDRNPGDFYVFDVAKKEATHLASRREWVDPEAMAAMRSVSFKARDGRALHGFLSIPQGSDGKNMALVVNPHGGPFGPADIWRFQIEPQLLASRGYAVLQINFRGSGNYGREHLRAGYQQWGLTMQDDLTDATRWAIEQGIADKDRVCLYGASYGGYASLMGVAKEPDLYQCAIGYVGVYDLPLMYQAGDIRDSKSGTNFLREALGGNRERLGANSPNRLAARIKVPVFLAAGGIDERAPLKHSELMRDALIAAGNTPEWLVYKDEGHGFYQDAHNIEYYTKLLAFLDRAIGPMAKH